MKKFYKFFMTLVAFAVAGVAQATDYVPEDAIEGIPEEGTQFALQITEGGEASKFLRGIAVSAALDDESLYEFEYVDTDADGNPRVYLKQVATGEYVKDAVVDPGLDGNDQWGMEQNIWYTAEAGEAMLLTAKIDENGKLNLITQQSNWHNGNGEFAPVYFGVWTIPSIGGWISKAWLPYTVVEQTPYEKVFSYLENNYQGGIEDRFTVGTSAGCISQEAYDALKAAYDAAFAMTEMGMDDVTAEMAEKAIADLKAAQALVDASVVPVTPGFYYITNTLFPRQGCFVNGTQIYHDAVDVAAEVTVDQAKFIWEVMDAGDGKFYLRNYYSNTYAGGGNSGVVPSVTEPVAYVIRTASEVVGSGKGFAISDAANPTKGWNRNGGDQLSTTVFWNAEGSDYANSYWNLTAIPAEAISHLEDAIAQDRLNKELQALVTNASGTLNSATYYVSDATQDGNFPNANGEGAEEYLADGIFTSGDQATTNAPEPNEGQPQGLISQMVDGNNGSFFHSTWSANNQYNSDVCLDIDLLKEYNALTAKLEFRITNGAAHTQGRPFHVTYYGTNDETLLLTNTIDPAAADSASYEGWTELGQTTFTYPYANSDGVAGTVGIAGMPFGDGNNFRYLRMRFTDNNAGSTAGWTYVCIAELRLYEATVDPKSPIANVDAAIAEALKSAIAASKAQIAAGTATREQIAALQEALDAFIAVCPDPNTLLTAISDARALVNGAPFTPSKSG